MPEYIDKCKKCYHFQVCANVMKNQLFIREKMLLEENPECEHFISAADVVEVVHGEWVETYQPLGFDEVKCAECSSCGEDWIMDDDVCIDDYKAHWKYCPCCGAKMDGERKDGDIK